MILFFSTSVPVSEMTDVWLYRLNSPRLEVCLFFPGQSHLEGDLQWEASYFII